MSKETKVVDKRYTSYLIDHPTSGCVHPKLDPRSVKQHLMQRSSVSLMHRTHGKKKRYASDNAFKDKDGAFRLVSLEIRAKMM